MNVIGIDLTGKEVRLVGLKKDLNGQVSIIPSAIKKLKFEDHYDNSEVRRLRDVLYSFFDELNPVRIAIFKRSDSSGSMFSVSPITFKTEGLIQCYSSVEIEFFPLATVKTYIVQNPLPLQPQFAYQKDALSLAYYLLQ